MLTALFNGGMDWHWLLTSPVMLAITGFQILMLIHALRHREWLWALFIFIGSGLGALWYYFSVYRESASGMNGFELPGAQGRARVRELQAKIAHLDNAYHHFQLGDFYLRKGKFAEAEKCYRAALEREPGDLDARAHLGQCLLRMGRPAEAKPLLQGVCQENYKHDFGYSLMAYAEALTALKQTEDAVPVWEHVVAHHSYPRAKVQLAQIYLAKNQVELARTQLSEVIKDDAHAPAFQRRRDRFWVRQARALLRNLG